MIIRNRTTCIRNCPLRAPKTPRAAMAIPACGVDNPRVRRFNSP